MSCESPLGLDETTLAPHDDEVVDVAVHVAGAETMEPDNAFAVHSNAETALAVHVKRAMGAVLLLPGPLELDAEQTFGKPDYLVDVVSRF
jgi:hypothetical protein